MAKPDNKGIDYPKYFNHAQLAKAASTSGIFSEKLLKKVFVTNKIQQIASAATNSRSLNGRIINLQMDKWIRAKKIFREEVFPHDDPKPEAMLEVISQLAESISTVCSRMFEENKAPDFKDCPDFLKEKGWGMEAEKPKLSAMFHEMNNYYRTEKHYDGRKESFLRSISKDKIIDYMEKSQQVWLWLLDKFHGGNIPAIYLVEFKENFKA